MPLTASSWLSKMRAGPLKVRMEASTPAVFTMQPSSAMLPNSTASPPSWLKALARSRITPLLRSASRSSQRDDWLKAICVGTPPGAARKNSATDGLLVRLISQRASPSARVLAWMEDTEVSSRPQRSSSPRMPMMPPARCTSSTCTLATAGATLHSTGTLRDSRSISAMVKSTPASCAAANRCSTVLVEPPMEISRHIAFSNAALLAMLRGSTEASSCS